MLFLFRPCRLSFVLCAIWAFLVDPDHASHITVADPPKFATIQPQGVT